MTETEYKLDNNEPLGVEQNDLYARVSGHANVMAMLRAFSKLYFFKELGEQCKALVQFIDLVAGAKALHIDPHELHLSVPFLSSDDLVSLDMLSLMQDIKQVTLKESGKLLIIFQIVD